MQLSIYSSYESGLHRLHPITKLALAGFFMLAALVLPGLWLTYAVVVLIVLPLVLWGKILIPFLRIALLATLPFAISIFLIQGFLWPNGTPIWWIGPFSLKQEGLDFTIRLVGRILLINSGLLLLSMATRPDALMLAMVQKGMPDVLAYIVLTTMQIAPRFEAKARTILDAQRSRGLETEGLINRFRALVPLIIPLVLGSIVDIEERAIALEARAFSRSGPKTSLFDLPDSQGQRVFRWGLLVTAILIVIIRLLYFREAVP